LRNHEMHRPSHSWTPFGAEKARYIKDLVETRRIELPTFALRTRRSPS
jgi:hypothetical protein